MKAREDAGHEDLYIWIIVHLWRPGLGQDTVQFDSCVDSSSRHRRAAAEVRSSWESVLRFVDGALPLDFSAGKSEGCVLLTECAELSPTVISSKFAQAPKHQCPAPVRIFVLIAWVVGKQNK